MLLNCGVAGDSWESLGLQGDEAKSILKEINPEYSLERLMLKLKFQYFGHLMQTDSLEKTLMLGKIEGRRRRVDRGWDGWMTSPTWWTWVWVNYGSWWWTEKPGIHGVTKSQIQLSNLTGMNWHVTWFLEYIFVENLFIICLFFFIHLHELIGQYSDIPLNACNLWQSFNGSLFQVPPSTNLRQ